MTKELLIIFVSCLLGVWSIQGAAALSPEHLMESDVVAGFHTSRTLHNFDREECERDCRRKLGDPVGAGGGGATRGSYYALSECIRQCNTTFWKDFDKKTGMGPKNKDDD
jgi:hypothetical protein